MTVYTLSISDIELLKQLLVSRLPTAKATARVEAMARGLGYETYASLRADLASSRKRVEVDDKAFVLYLKTHGMASVPPGALDSALTELKAIDDIATREMLSSMPDTLDEFLDWMEAHEGPPYVMDWAIAFGVVEECYCGTKVIQPGDFADEVLAYYEIEDNRENNAFNRIVAALVHSGVEVGEGGMGGDLCSYHADQEAKDD